MSHTISLTQIFPDPNQPRQIGSHADLDALYQGHITHQELYIRLFPERVDSELDNRHDRGIRCTVKRFVESIRAAVAENPAGEGMIHPITVRQVDENRYVILHGHLRYWAWFWLHMEMPDHPHGRGDRTVAKNR